MSRLFRFEFRKVFRSKYLYILLGGAIGYVFLNGLTLYFVNWILENLVTEAGEVIPPGMFDYNSYSYTKSAINSNFLMIIGIFIAIFSCEDNGHGTAKNIIGKGYSRIQVFFSKYLTSLILTVGISIAAILAASLFGLIAWGADSFDKGDDILIVIILGQLLSVIVYHMVFFAIAYSVGRSGGAIVINILAPLGLSLVFQIVDILINREGFSLNSYWIDGILLNFNSTTNTDLFVSNFLLLFVYYAAALVPSILVARRKQY